MMRKIIVILTLLVFNVKAVTWTAVGCPGPVTWGGFTAGNCPFWNGPTQLTSQPAAGDILVIPAGCTVTVNSNISVSNNITVQVNGPNGQLKFAGAGDKLQMTASSTLIVATGSSLSGPSASNQVFIGSGGPEWNGPGTTAGTFTLVNGGYLPVEFIAFTGNLEVKVVFLSWKTLTETNNAYFDIEKSSDGINFEKFTTVPSQAINGNSTKTLTYNAIDNDLKHPIYYYRLKQVDIDGTYKYSTSISVKIYSPELKIYPNPNNGAFWIDVPTAKTNQKIDVKIYDQVSNQVLNTTYNVANDNITGASVKIEPNKPIAKGVYYAVINFEGTEYRLKLIVN